MERADWQRAAPLETAAPPTVERQREQQRIQAPSCISPRDPRLTLSSQADMQPGTAPAQPLHSDSTAGEEDSGSPESVDREDGQPLGRSSSLTQAAGSEGQQGAEDRSQRRCSHCGCLDPAGKSYRHPTTRAWLCHACGMYARLYNGRLPSAAVLQRRVQQRQVVAASKLRHVAPNQRQCLQCGADTPGAGQHWRRHPATKEEWMCIRCYQRALYQLKRRREHEAAAPASGSDGGEESWEEGEEAQPSSQSPPAPQQQAAPVQPPMPGPPVQQHAPATVGAYGFAGARQQQQPQGMNPDTAWEPAPEQPALLPVHDPQPQASTGLLVLEAAQQAAATAAGLTEGLAGTFSALLPMPAEQDGCLRLMLQRRQFSGAAGLMRAVLHMRGIPPPGLSQAPLEQL